MTYCSSPGGPIQQTACPRQVETPGDLCAFHRKQAQREFVKQWRQEHADDVYGESWTCPLCGKVIQVGSSDPAHDQFVSVLAEKHKRFHGDDWLAYQAAGAEPGGDDRSD